MNSLQYPLPCRLPGRRLNSLWSIYDNPAYHTAAPLLQAIKSGAGIGTLPIIVGEQEDDLVRLSGPIPNLATGFYLLMHQDMKTTPRVRAFFDFVIEEIAAIRDVLGTGQTIGAKSRKGRH